MKTISILILLCIILSGCSPEAQEKMAQYDLEQDRRFIIGTGTITRWRDDEKSVTCWVYYNSSALTGGISCIPDSSIPLVRQ